MRVATVTALGVVLALLVASVPALGATRQLTLGVATPDGRDLAQLDAFRASIGGTRVRLWTIWTNFGRGSIREFPTAAATGVRARGAVPFIWWEPIEPSDWSDPTYTRNLNIINGDHDAYIRAYAREAKAFGTTILLRFAHQANSDYLPWGWDYSDTDDNTVATFKAMWRHVHGIFQEEGATNVRWVWTIATQTCSASCLRSPLGYPGDRYVDYMGFTWENWAKAPPGSVRPSEPWRSMIKGFRPIVKRLMRISGKPIVGAAVASAPGGGNRARWIRRGYNRVYRELPRVKIINYLNVDLSGPPSLHRDWSLWGGALEAYAAVASRYRFKGHIR